MLSSVGQHFHGVRRSFWGKKFQYDKPRLIALFCHKTSKKRKTVCRVDQFGLSKFCVICHREATSRLAPNSRTCNFKMEKAVKMKLASLLVLLAMYRKLQTDLKWPVPTPRYSWPNMAFHAYSPSMAPNVKGMMTLTYDLALSLIHI